MKISEGIRLGSQGKIQIKGRWYDNKNGVCAIGALMKLPGLNENVYKTFPELQSKISNCNNVFLINEIVERNEKGQTFEQIIVWLESIGH